MELRDRIHAVRKELKLTQKDFGERIGVAGNTVTNYEVGRREPMESTIKAICREFHVNYDWLKDGEGEMFESLPESMVDELAQEFDLDELDRNIILGYLRLSTSDRAAVKRYVLGLAEQICGQ